MTERKKVGDISKMFGIDPETVREWSKQFEPFLSEDANPPKGATRYYNEDDLNALAFVFRARRHDSTFEEIRAALDLGQHRISIPNLIAPGDSDLGGAGSGRQIVRLEDMEQWHQMAGELKSVVGERDHLRGELKQEREAHSMTRERAARAEAAAEAPRAPTVATEPRAMVLWRWLLVVLLVAITAVLVWQGMTP